MVLEIGNKSSAKVTSITKFGAFVKLDTGETGLVHISEVSDTFINNVSDVLNVGDVVEVKVVAVAPDGKISFSIRQAVEKKEQLQKEQTNKFEFKQERRLPKFSEPNKAKKTEDFDALMSAFLKDSDERLLSLKRNTEGKRGGRGGRRS
ncbi:MULTISPECIES: S1 domain-containing RNA-binding protein [unclassified Granulicatella]|uniref:S1 domain-containing RNA-binding protein n=1 Tax=unclassified Granulicatella TaxID=2630493 RepID=UPI001073EAF0|nr:MULTISPECIES: S1 domain-containing RNA-binding protein [unclassified Granulicatella]MBF0780004.1 RNA-binding protein S1 [Granulicatella sp. 19428wC4_WM01]TFU95931.1 RNA-binding protein S1 [Granulicatella sp. WM01]